MSPSYSPADWIWEHLNAASLAQIGPVCLLFDASGGLLSRKQCLLIHLCAPTPAQGCEFSAVPARLSEEAQSGAQGYSLRAWIYEQYLFLSAKKLQSWERICATVDSTSHTLTNMGKSQPDSAECLITPILFVQHCPLKFFSGVPPQAPSGPESEEDAASQYSSVIYH